MRPLRRESSWPDRKEKELSDQGPTDPEDFDAGWLVEGEHGEAMDLTKLPAIIQDRIDRYPDQAEMQRWATEHPGTNMREVEGVEGAWTLYLYDQANGVEFVFGEFHRDELLAYEGPALSRP
jgi:hypothetical protein